MRIALRTSGGRGEYELAGHQGDIQASDLFDRELIYEFTPNLIIPGRAFATRMQGKPRIRLEDQDKTTHLYRLIAGLLLLPKPKRELKETHGVELLSNETYSMTAIKVDIADIQKKSVTLRPTDLLLENADNQQLSIDVAHRLSRVVHLWEIAAQKTDTLSGLLREHQKSVMTVLPNFKYIEKCSIQISNYVKATNDPLPVIEKAFGVVVSLSDTATQLLLQPVFGMDDDTPPIVARIERVRKWRQLAVRGPGGYRFRAEVSSAYNYRCAFTGKRLPRMDITDSSGVDAAHILPWSTHDINSVRNGICLDKLCHWAFDEGILKLSFDSKSNNYLIEVPDKVQKTANISQFDIKYFLSLTGPISRSHLPVEQNRWPSPKYIEALNKYMEQNISV